jgi:hypothetical protein
VQFLALLDCTNVEDAVFNNRMRKSVGFVDKLSRWIGNGYVPTELSVPCNMEINCHSVFGKSTGDGKTS